MAYWHKEPIWLTGFTRFQGRQKLGGGARRREENADSLYDIYLVTQFKRRKRPVEYWHKEPIVARTYTEAKLLASELAKKAETGFDESLFEQKPVPPYSWEMKVKEIVHPAKRVRADIYRHSDELFTVNYFKYHPLKAGTVVLFESPIFRELITYADSLESIEEIAMIELDQMDRELQVHGEPESNLHVEFAKLRTAEEADRLKYEAMLKEDSEKQGGKE